MLHEAAFLEQHFKSGMEFESFVGMLPFDQQASWVQRHGQLELTGDQQELLGSFSRDMKILCLTGPWCGDCPAGGRPGQDRRRSARSDTAAIPSA